LAKYPVRWDRRDHVTPRAETSLRRGSAPQAGGDHEDGLEVSAAAIDAVRTGAEREAPALAEFSWNWTMPTAVASQAKLYAELIPKPPTLPSTAVDPFQESPFRERRS